MAYFDAATPTLNALIVLRMSACKSLWIKPPASPNCANCDLFSFDAFHDEQTTQQGVFVANVKPILSHILRGQNASVFAYGPTGAGRASSLTIFVP